jgi:hypothetical protein
MQATSFLLAITAFAGLLAPVDVAEILAAPPSSDYAQANDSTVTINGPLDSYTYGEWLASTSAEVSGNEAAFDQHGFTRGYARSWSTLSQARPHPGVSRHIYLVETIEEYSSHTGAQWRFDAIESYTKGGGDDFVREIASPIPDSFGAVAESGAYYFVMFVRGNDVYIVRFDAEVDDMTQAVVEQATRQSEIAPPYTIPPSQWVVATQSPSADAESSPVSGKTIVSLVVVAIVFVGRAIGFVAGLVRRRGSA